MKKVNKPEYAVEFSIYENNKRVYNRKEFCERKSDGILKFFPFNSQVLVTDKFGVYQVNATIHFKRLKEFTMATRKTKELPKEVQKILKSLKIIKKL